MHRRSLLAAPLLLSPALGSRPAAAHDVAAGELTIARPWSRAAGAGGTGAGYLTIVNRGAAADRLVSASSPAARKTELHTHMREGEVMRMREVPGIEIPPGQSVAFAPGGLHVMLVGLTQALQAGTTVPLTLVFERAGPVQVELHVEAAGARGPSAH